MPALPPGTRLGPYRVEEAVGRGGMGEVYRAVDTRLGRTVAVKVLPEELSGDPDRRRRLEREARIVSGLSHPHICTLFDVGQESNIGYLVMEFLEGETLDVRLARGALDLAEALSIAIDVGRALVVAHGRGIVHRDLKPANLMLTGDGVKVLDFGLAKAWLSSLWPADASDSDTSLTGDGAVVGTPPYMSPEQLRGDDVTAATDVFALGAVLFEMITGRAAFTGPTSVAVAASVLSRERPSLVDVKPDVPKALDRVVTRCLALSPDARWPTMTALVEALEGIAATSRSAGRTKRTASRHSSHPRLWVAAVTAVVVVGAGLVRWSDRGPSGPPTIAILPFNNATGDRSLDPLLEGITMSVIDVLSGLQDLRVTSWSSVDRYREGAGEVEASIASLGVDQVVTARVTAVDDRFIATVDIASVAEQVRVATYSWPRGDDRAVPRDISRLIVDHLLIPVPREAVRQLGTEDADNPEAFRAYLEGLSAFSRRDLRDALRLYRQAIDLDSTFAPAAAGLASTYALFGTMGWDISPPDEVVPAAREWATEALRLNPNLAEARAAHAFVLRFECKRLEAEQEHLLSVELNPSCATCLQWLASYYWTQNRFNEALAYLTRAQELDGQSAVIRLNLGRHYYYQREYELAIPRFREALEVDPDFWLAAQLIILSQVELGDLPAAREEFERLRGAPALNRRVLEAFLLASEGRVDESLAAVDDLRRRSAETYLPPYLLAPIYAALDNAEAAMEALEAAEAEQSGYLEYLGLEPTLDPVRAHERYATLLERMRLQDFTPPEVLSVRPAA